MDKGNQPKRKCGFSRAGGFVIIAKIHPDGTRKERRRKRGSGAGGWHVGSKSAYRTATGKRRKPLNRSDAGAFGGRTLVQRKARKQKVKLYPFRGR